MISSRSIAVSAFAMLLLASRIPAHDSSEDPWGFPDFSATQILHSEKYDIPMKVFRSGSSLRVERNAAMTTLYVPAIRTVYDLTTYPDASRVCIVMKPEQAKRLPSPLELLYGVKVKRSPAGSDVFEGHKCKVESAEVTRTDGIVIQSKVWQAEDLGGAPVKIESQLPETRITAFYRDVVIGTPDNALFNPPDKCTPYEKMGQIAEQKIIK